MGGTYRPRHIRDIAHLYISNSQSTSYAPSATLLTVGENRRCFSGFHAANLAAALSAKGVCVHLFERSGVLPNAGFFMSLPPRRYIPWEDDEDAPVAGVGGVTIDCSPKGFPTFEGDSRCPRVDVVHLPPTLPEKPFQEGLRDVRGFVQPVTILLILRIGKTTSGEIPECVARELGPVAACVLYLDDTGPHSRDDDPSVCDLGSVTDWVSALRDRVPAVIRAPDSALSRVYLAVCDRVLFKINQLRGETGAERAFGTSAATRSR